MRSFFPDPDHRDHQASVSSDGVCGERITIRLYSQAAQTDRGRGLQVLQTDHHGHCLSPLTKHCSSGPQTLKLVD
jgi:hypothetical protein